MTLLPQCNFHHRRRTLRDYDSPSRILNSRRCGSWCPPAGSRNQRLPAFLDLVFSEMSRPGLAAGLIISVVPHSSVLQNAALGHSMVPEIPCFRGVFRAFGWSLGMLADSPMIRTPLLTRTLATLRAFVGIIFVAFSTAPLTANRYGGGIRCSRSTRPPRSAGQAGVHGRRHRAGEIPELDRRSRPGASARSTTATTP